MFHDTGAWIVWSSQIAEKHGENVAVVSWVHSHVRGIACSFSSIDMHAQYAYNKHFPGILGLVFQIGLNGDLQKFDFYSLTGIGTAAVGRCSRSRNLSRHLHEECKSDSFYQSQKNLVTF